MNKFILMFFLITGSILGQEINTTEVKVLESFKPSVPAAIRLNENASFADTINSDKTQFYKIQDAILESDYSFRPLSPAKVKPDKIFNLYSTKFGIGFGNAWSTKAGILHNSKRSKTMSYGFLANHYSNKYDLAKSSINDLHLYFKNISSKTVFNVNFDFDRRTSFYHDKTINIESSEYFTNRFSYTKLSISAVSRKVEKKQLHYNTTFFVSDFNEFSENQIHLSSVLKKQINGRLFFGHIEINNFSRYNGLENRPTNSDLSIFSFSTYTNINKYGLDFNISLATNFVTDSKFNFFPQIKISKELVKDVLLIEGGLRYFQINNSLRSISIDNPYINSFGTRQVILSDSIILQQLKVTDQQELYFKFRNILSKNEILVWTIAYSKINNFAHYINSGHFLYNRFNVAYLNLHQMYSNLSYNKKINQIFNFDLDLDYFKWSETVYNKSDFNLKINFPVNMRNKIKVIPSLSYFSDRLVSERDKEKNPAITTIDLSLQYFYSKQLSAYIDLKNLTNSKHEFWYGYKEIGLNILFGINFSF